MTLLRNIGLFGEEEEEERDPFEGIKLTPPPGWKPDPLPQAPVAPPKIAEPDDPFEGIKLTPPPGWEPEEEEERGFFGNMATSFERGLESADLQQAVHTASVTQAFGGDLPAAIKAMDDFYARQQADPVEGDNWLSSTAHEVAQMAGPMIKGSLQGGLAAAAAVAAGQAGPQVAIPEEVITAPTAFAYGSGQYWYRQGAGAFTYEMVKQGVDPTVAAVVAGGAAVPYALLEGMQVSRIIPGMKTIKEGLVEEAFRRMLKSEPVRKAIGAGTREAAAQVTRYGVGVVREAGEEVSQELVGVAAEEMGKQINNLIFDTNLETTTAPETLERMKETITSSAAPLAMLMLPMSGIGGVRAVRGARRSERGVEKEADFSGDESVGGVDTPAPVLPYGLEELPEVRRKDNRVEVDFGGDRGPKELQAIFGEQEWRFQKQRGQEHKVWTATLKAQKLDPARGAERSGLVQELETGRFQQQAEETAEGTEAELTVAPATEMLRRGLESRRKQGVDVRVPTVQTMEEKPKRKRRRSAATPDAIIREAGGIAESEIDRIYDAIGKPDDKRTRHSVSRWKAGVSSVTVEDMLSEALAGEESGTVLRSAGITDFDSLAEAVRRGEIFERHATSPEQAAEREFAERPINISPEAQAEQENQDLFGEKVPEPSRPRAPEVQDEMPFGDQRQLPTSAIKAEGEGLEETDLERAAIQEADRMTPEEIEELMGEDDFDLFQEVEREGSPLKAIAIHLRDGTIYEGKPGEIHASVMLDAIDELKMTGEQADDMLDNFETDKRVGFVDNNGDFLNREEAWALVHEDEQGAASTGRAESQDMRAKGHLVEDFPEEMHQEGLHPLEQKMLDEYGDTTPDDFDIGFILSDGTATKRGFHEKSGESDEHYEMAEKVTGGAGLDATTEFLKAGAIRVMPMGGPLKMTVFEVESLPTAGQIRTMAKAAAVADQINVEYQGKLEQFPTIGGMQRFFAAQEDQGETLYQTERSHKGEVSTRNPTAVKATENPHTDFLLSDFDAVKGDRAWVEHTARLIRPYSNPSIKSRKPEEQLEGFIDHIADNLVWLHDHVPRETREKTRKWYDAANRAITKVMAPEYGITPEQGSAIIAVTSPQNEWGNNTSQAFRILDTLVNRRGDQWSPEMESQATALSKHLAKESKSRGKSYFAKQKAITAVRGKTYDQLEESLEKAVWLRIHDEAHRNRDQRVITLEGTIVEAPVGSIGPTGEKIVRMGWNSLNPIAKAISIFEDGSVENISNQLGEQHKIRNFHNNLLVPYSLAPHVTVDTHAVAAGLLRPLAGTDDEVKHNFGGKRTNEKELNEAGEVVSETKYLGPKNSSIYGISGTYALYLEAYVRAAKRLGIAHPRELQSITWEAGRALFLPDTKKVKGIQQDINGVWRRVEKGEITPNEGRQEIYSIATGESIRLVEGRRTKGDMTDAEAEAEIARIERGIGAGQEGRSDSRLDDQEGPGPGQGDLRGPGVPGQRPPGRSTDRRRRGTDPTDPGVTLHQEATVREPLTFRPTPQARALDQRISRLRKLKRPSSAQTQELRRLESVARDPGQMLHQEETENLKTFLGESVIRDPLFRGSMTDEGNVMDPSKASPEGYFGKSIYFTDESEDASENYANPTGADVEIRIEEEMERVTGDGWAGDQLTEEEMEKYSIGPDDGLGGGMQEVVRQIAEDRLNEGSGPTVSKYYVRMENPLDIRPGADVMLESEFDYGDLEYDLGDQATERVMENYDVTREVATSPEWKITREQELQELADENGYEPEITGTLEDFLAALDQAASRYDDITEAPSAAVREKFEIYGSTAVNAKELVMWLKSHGDSPVSAAYDYESENGMMASAEVVRAAIEGAGFDGVIMSADEHFPRMKNIGGTTHYMAFNEAQVKSATGNTGAYSRDTTDVRYQEKKQILAKITSYQNKASVIELSKAANAESLPHEVSHLFFEQDRKTGAFKNLTEKEGRRVFDFLGLSYGSKLTRPEHETLADATVDLFFGDGALTSEGSAIRQILRKVGLWIRDVVGSPNATAEFRKTLEDIYGGADSVEFLRDQFQGAEGAVQARKAIGAAVTTSEVDDILEEAAGQVPESSLGALMTIAERKSAELGPREERTVEEEPEEPAEEQVEARTYQSDAEEVIGETIEERSIDLPAETARGYLQRKIQDKLNRLQQVQEAIGDVPEELDARLEAELFIGRAAERIDEFRKKIIDDKDSFLNRLIEAGYTIDDMGDYLYARHAQERNAHVLEKYEKEDGSGMSDEEAQAVLAHFKGTAIEGFAAEFYRDVTVGALDARLDAGLIDQETYDRLTSFYADYVPLKGTSKNTSIAGVGKGFSVSGPDLRAARGRRERADNPFIQAMLDYEEAVIRAEKAPVGQALLALAEENPDPTIWEVEAQRHMPVYNKDGEIEYLSPLIDQSRDTLDVKVDGKTSYVKIKDEALASGLKNLGAGRGIPMLQAVNTVLRSLSTTLNPEFLITNFERDLQTALVHLAGEHSGKVARKVLKDTPLAVRGIWKGRNEVNNKWAEHYADFKKQGGKVGWFDQSTIEEKQAELEKKVNQARSKGNTRAVYQAAAKGISDANEAVESGVRLAAYVNLVEEGVSKKRAAYIAKNLTVNFNKKGDWGSVINSLWLFSNASIQGTTRIFQAMKHPKVAGLVAGMAGMAYMSSHVNRMISEGDDDDPWEDVAPWVKDNYWIQVLPGGKMLSLKVPYGYNIFLVFGRVVEEMQYGDLTPAEGISRVFGALNDSFNPLGGGSLNQFLAPTFLDLPVQIADNENFAGAPIQKDQPAYGPKIPESQRFFTTVREPTQAFTSWLNRTTGGSAKVAGDVDVSPEVIDHVIDFIGGGLGKFIANAVTTGKSVFDEGVLPDIQNVPVARQFIKGPSEWTPARLAYEIIEESGRKIYPREQQDRFLEALRRGVRREAFTEEQREKFVTDFFRNQAKAKQDLLDHAQIMQASVDVRLMEAARLDAARRHYNSLGDVDGVTRMSSRLRDLFPSGWTREFRRKNDETPRTSWNPSKAMWTGTRTGWQRKFKAGKAELP